MQASEALDVAIIGGGHNGLVCAAYLAAAGKTISAEKTTITGSIGVFVALPNVAKLAHDHGVKLELIKAGGGIHCMTGFLKRDSP